GHRYLIAGLNVARVNRRAVRVGGVRKVDTHLPAPGVDADLIAAALHARHAAGQPADLARRQPARLLHTLRDSDGMRAHFTAAGDGSRFGLDANAVADFETADAIGVALIDDRRRRDRAHGQDLAAVGLDHDASLASVDLAHDAVEAADAIGRGARRGAARGRSGNRRRRSRLTDASLRRRDASTEERDALGADHVVGGAGAAHFDAVAFADVRESRRADEDLRRAVDRAAEAVVLRRHRVGVD